MKKSLWTAAVILAVGFGMSTHAAVTNATFSEWSFETISSGTRLKDANQATPIATDYGSWSADTNNFNTAYITNVTVDMGGVGTPIAGTHDRTLYFDGSVTNHFDITLLDGKRYVTDFLLKPGQLEDPSLLGKVDANARCAFFFDTNGYFNLLHGVDGVWVTSLFNTVVYDSNAWVRVAIDQDYVNFYNFTYNLFTIAVNGTNLSSGSVGYTRTGNSFSAGGATPIWFQMKNSETSSKWGMNALVGMGIGQLDDVKNALYSEGGSPKTITVSANAAWGSIGPNGSVVLAYNTSSNFVITASAVDAYVAGLKVDATQIYTNTSDTLAITTQPVAWAQATNGSVVVALFAAKANTGTARLSGKYTNIGEPGGYATFAIAATNDADGDGFNNEKELAAGTDPDLNTSYLKITNIVVNAGVVSVYFEGKTAGVTADYVLTEADTVGQNPYSNVAYRAKIDGNLGVTNTPAVWPKFYKIAVPYTPYPQP